MDREELAHAISRTSLIIGAFAHSPDDMTQLLDFTPILVFVATYYFSDIYVATAALIAATAAQIGVTVLLRRAVSRQLKLTFWITLILGGLTLLLHDKAFIQWKPTIVNLAFACALIGSQYVGKRIPAPQRLMGDHLNLPDAVWRRINVGWAIGFAILAVLNLYVAFNFSERFWVNYKLFGGYGIIAFYALLTAAYLARGGYLREHDERVEGVERANGDGPPGRTP
jgi:intracellular septation protein